MNWGLGYRFGSPEAREGGDLEESVMDWLTQYEPRSWVPSAIVLGLLLLTIVLLPLSRLA